jgi:hypothetical protein
MAEETVSVPVASGVNCITSDDGKFISFVFHTPKGPISAAMPASNIGDMVAELIRVAQQLSATTKTEIAQNETITARPIDVAALGVSPGRIPSEGILAIRTGPLTLSFSVQLSNLLGMCENLRRVTALNPNAGKLQ